MKNIMIVDDSPSIREALKLQLSEDPDRHIMIASGVVEACELLSRESGASFPHFLITDYNMPDGNGLDVIRHVRETLKRQNVQICLMSVDVTDDMRKQALELGANMVLAKQKLPGIIRQILADKSL